MVIAAVDHALESLLRAALPLPEEVGDVSFEVPDGTWGSQLSRITVNVYLFDVARSSQPPRPAERRVRDDGRVELRGQLPVVKLSYMVSAWAGNTGDEHQLLSEVLTALVTYQVVPEEHLPEPFAGAVHLALAQREGRRPGDLWGGLQGRMKPALELEVTVALSSQPWLLAPPSVDRIAGLVAPRPDEPPEPPLPRRATTVRRGADGSLERVAAATDPPGGE
ncbi:MAG: hypothetical protein QOE45_3020 [Frankiaceae bacterium]|jgi:hypothetical protein|nr:hypothetical protein [Frankiaceae bacterium]